MTDYLEELLDQLEEEEAEMIDNGRYRYPKLVFVRRNE